MTETSIVTSMEKGTKQICTFSSPYPIEKFKYLHEFPIKMETNF